MLLNSLNSCVNPWIYLLFNRSLVNALRYQVCRCPDKSVISVTNVTSCTASSCPSTAIVAELTTQGTDAGNTLSRLNSPIVSTVRRTAPTIVPEKLLEPQRLLAGRDSGQDKIEMMAVVCKSADSAPWHEKIVFVRKSISYQDFVHS
ncbi:unnamed protein product [Ixodes persulcatus]